ncbi:MAG: hypothetical protein EKK29_04955 [Hyphomicrobiales bacterium]|nr:MAG: hypothetical protein EKK29_04955 [Hyphomicrobiales bacterium]
MIDCTSDYTKADWSLVPEALRPALLEYIEQGRNPGVFLTSVLVGDLFAAANLAPESVRPHIGSIARLIVSHAPKKCWGGMNEVSVWMATGAAPGNGLKIAA